MERWHHLRNTYATHKLIASLYVQRSNMRRIRITRQIKEMIKHYNTVRRY